MGREKVEAGIISSPHNGGAQVPTSPLRFSAALGRGRRPDDARPPPGYCGPPLCPPVARGPPWAPQALEGACVMILRRDHGTSSAVEGERVQFLKPRAESNDKRFPTTPRLFTNIKPLGRPIVPERLHTQRRNNTHAAFYAGSSNFKADSFVRCHCCAPTLRRTDLTVQRPGMRRENTTVDTGPFTLLQLLTVSCYNSKCSISTKEVQI